jgi:cytochrome c peroxidase
MASNHDLAVKVISSIPAYVEEFKLAFGSGKETAIH